MLGVHGVINSPHVRKYEEEDEEEDEEEEDAAAAAAFRGGTVAVSAPVEVEVEEVDALALEPLRLNLLLTLPNMARPLSSLWCCGVSNGEALRKIAALVFCMGHLVFCMAQKADSRDLARIVLPPRALRAHSYYCSLD